MCQISSRWSKRLNGSIQSREHDWTFGDGLFWVQFCIEILYTLNFDGTFDQLSFEIFMWFSQEMPFYYFYTMVQNSQKRPKTQIKGGVPALKTYIAQFTEGRMIMKPRTCKVIVENAFFFFFFFNIAGKHERLYCWLSHLHIIAQGRHETAGICLFSWFCYDISVKEKKKKEENSWRSSSSDLHRLFPVKNRRWEATAFPHVPTNPSNNSITRHLCCPSTLSTSLSLSKRRQEENEGMSY